jgi:hypothetical protein
VRKNSENRENHKKSFDQLMSSVDVIPALSSSSSTSSSSSSSTGRRSRIKPSILKSEQELERQLQSFFDSLSLLRIRIPDTPTAVVLPTTVVPSPVRVVDHDDDDDDDDEHVVDTAADAISEVSESDWSSISSDCDDAPHPADEEHWFSAAEEHAFRLAGVFDRTAPRPRHATMRGRAKPKKRAGRTWLPSARATDSERLVTESANVSDATPPASTVVMPRPRAAAASRSEDVDVSRAIAESRRQAQDASRLVDANLAQTVGLSAAQLAAMLTRELTPADYELLLALDNAVAAKTIKKDALAELLTPVQHVSADDVCCICFDELSASALSSLRQLPCNHAFHKACIEKHLGEFSRRCPNCNFNYENEK